MRKWSAIVVIMMMMVMAATVTVEAKHDWIRGFERCFRNCSTTSSCADNDGDCFERCKLLCGGPNPPHGLTPPPGRFSSSRISRGMASVEVRGRKE
ncbi:unnamed protein product [Microthlaspi erraticum]|uniref:Knottin scorpion toxin-like domain-containing protein n=1 Tax=Microthlaspi erraticum TaxID=1685480 RepID=A0A6D2HRM9_9BRAS|nr:unnamed protein product [Microthlaspi erraticum]